MSSVLFTHGCLYLCIRLHMVARTLPVSAVRQVIFTYNKVVWRVNLFSVKVALYSSETRLPERIIPLCFTCFFLISGEKPRRHFEYTAHHISRNSGHRFSRARMSHWHAHLRISQQLGWFPYIVLMIMSNRILEGCQSSLTTCYMVTSSDVGNSLRRKWVWGFLDPITICNVDVL